jgi:hypothetical protein
MNPPSVIASQLLGRFEPLYRLQTEEIHWVGQRIPLPEFSLLQIQNLIEAAKTIITQEASPVLDLPLPAWIIGDLHGNFHDLLRTLSKIRDFTSDRLIFLGDYVDRGDYSLDVLILLLTLKCQHPGTVYLLRGNHEFEIINEAYGFKDEIDQRFPSSGLWEQFNELFCYLPFAAVLGAAYICLHGGIGPTCQTLQSIRRISIPVRCFVPGDVISEVVWSDPEQLVVGFSASPRGRGSLFGARTLEAFLLESKCRGLLRAHQCVAKGLEEFHRGLGMTVFTTSNYAGKENAAGFVHISAREHMATHHLRPIRDLVPRAYAVFEAREGLMASAPRTSLSMTSLYGSINHFAQRSPPRIPLARGRKLSDTPDTRREGVRLLVRSASSALDIAQRMQMASVVAGPKT